MGKSITHELPRGGLHVAMNYASGVSGDTVHHPPEFRLDLSPFGLEGGSSWPGEPPDLG